MRTHYVDIWPIAHTTAYEAVCDCGWRHLAISPDWAARAGRAHLRAHRCPAIVVEVHERDEAPRP